MFFSPLQHLHVSLQGSSRGNPLAPAVGREMHQIRARRCSSRSCGAVGGACGVSAALSPGRCRLEACGVSCPAWHCAQGTVPFPFGKDNEGILPSSCHSSGRSCLQPRCFPSPAACAEASLRSCPARGMGSGSRDLEERAGLPQTSLPCSRRSVGRTRKPRSPRCCAARLGGGERGASSRLSTIRSLYSRQILWQQSALDAPIAAVISCPIAAKAAIIPGLALELRYPPVRTPLRGRGCRSRAARGSPERKAVTVPLSPRVTSWLRGSLFGGQGALLGCFRAAGSVPGGARLNGGLGVLHPHLMGWLWQGGALSVVPGSAARVGVAAPKWSCPRLVGFWCCCGLMAGF